MKLAAIAIVISDDNNKIHCFYIKVGDAGANVWIKHYQVNKQGSLVQSTASMTRLFYYKINRK